MKPLILLTGLFLALNACDNSSLSTENTPSPVGEWEFMGTKEDDSGVAFDFKVRIVLNADHKATLSLFVTSNYKDGFDGSWTQDGNDISISPSKCYKADLNGVIRENACSEDYDFQSMNGTWSGDKIVVGDPGNQYTLSRK